MQLSALTSALGRFVSELQRRKVLRVASAYVVVGWIILQVAVTLQTAMNLPAVFSTVIVSLLIVGLPVALVGSWFLEITPEGVKRTVASGDGALLKPQTPDFILAGALVLVLVVAVVQMAMPRDSAPATTTATGEAPKPKREPPALGDKSIAVLPFANLSPDKDDVFFADGLTEEILNILAQVRGIKVISRTSSFAFKGKDVPLPEIAKRLGVRHILEGSVRRNGNDVRITAQLIDVSTDVHVWSKVFERKLADVFAVQDDIARAIARALNTEISVSAGSRGAPTTNMDAYRLYLKAQELPAQSVTKESLLESIDLCKRAIELDPKFAEVYSVLSGLYSGMITYDAAHTAEWLTKAREAGATASRLKPNGGGTYAGLAIRAHAELNWEAAIENISRAIELEPSNSRYLYVLGHMQNSVGMIDKATHSFEESALLDPLFGLGDLRLAVAALARGDNTALAGFAAKHRSSEGLVGLFANLSLVLVAKEKGDLEGAVRDLRAFHTLFPQNNSIVEPVARAIKDATWHERAVQALKQEGDRDASFDPESYYLLLGDADALSDSISRGLATKVWFVRANHLAYVWHLVARGEGANAKLKDLFQEIGLVDYWKKHGWPDRCRAKGEDDFECS